MARRRNNNPYDLRAEDIGDPRRRQAARAAQRGIDAAWREAHPKRFKYPWVTAAEQMYTFADGDTLDTVATANNTTVPDILAANPDMTSPQTGMVIKLGPGRSSGARGPRPGETTIGTNPETAAIGSIQGYQGYAGENGNRAGRNQGMGFVQSPLPPLDLSFNFDPRQNLAHVAQGARQAGLPGMGYALGNTALNLDSAIWGTARNIAQWTAKNALPYVTRGAGREIAQGFSRIPRPLLDTLAVFNPGLASNIYQTRRGNESGRSATQSREPATPSGPAPRTSAEMMRELMYRVDSGMTPTTDQLIWMERQGLIVKDRPPFTPPPYQGGSDYGGGGYGGGYGGGGRGGGRMQSYPPRYGPPRLPAFSGGGGIRALVNWRI